MNSASNRDLQLQERAPNNGAEDRQHIQFLINRLCSAIQSAERIKSKWPKRAPQNPESPIPPTADPPMKYFPPPPQKKKHSCIVDPVPRSLVTQPTHCLGEKKDLSHATRPSAQQATNPTSAAEEKKKKKAIAEIASEKILLPVSPLRPHPLTPFFRRRASVPHVAARSSPHPNSQSFGRQRSNDSKHDRCHARATMMPCRYARHHRHHPHARGVVGWQTAIMARREARAARTGQRKEREKKSSANISCV